MGFICLIVRQQRQLIPFGGESSKSGSLASVYLQALARTERDKWYREEDAGEGLNPLNREDGEHRTWVCYKGLQGRLKFFHSVVRDSFLVWSTISSESDCMLHGFSACIITVSTNISSHVTSPLGLDYLSGAYKDELK